MNIYGIKRYQNTVNQKTETNNKDNFCNNLIKQNFQYQII